MRLKGEKVLQGTKPLVPVRRLSINLDAFGLLDCRMIGYSDKEPPLEANLFLDTWKIMGPQD